MKRRIKRLETILSTLWCTVGGTVIMWGVLSYIEIISKNLQPNPAYSSWNLIIMLYKFFA